MQTRELIARVRKIEIKTRKIVEDIAGGAYRSMFKGRGIEFSEVRAYSREDDVRDIDWNVTARMGAPYIRKYVEERELTVILAVDISASTFFGTGAEVKREKIAEAAALLAFSAIRNNDNVGLILFTDRIELYLPPASSRKHVLRLIRELVAFEPRGRKTVLSPALEFISRSQKKRTAVFLFSDFADAGDYEFTMKLLSRKHDLAAFRVLDPSEENMKFLSGLQLTDLESGENFLAGIRPDAYSQAEKQIQKENENILRRAGADLLELRCNEDIVPSLIRFFRGRRRIRGRAGA